MRKRVIPRLALCLLFCVAQASVWAQNARSTINGRILDSSNSAIPSATVTVTEQNTGLRFTARSQIDGEFLVPDLLSGTYRISGEAKGFKVLTVEGLKLDVGTTLTQDLKLVVGDITENVTVAGTTNLTESTGNTSGTTVDGSHVLEIPMIDRLAFSLMNLVPGAYYQQVVVDNPWYNTYSGIVIGGARQQDVMSTLDGVDIHGNVGIAGALGPVMINPPPDAIQEFRVETNNLSAEYGHAATSWVNAVIKSGSNALHGDVYWVVRNDLFDAAGWGNPSKPKLRRNTVGGTVGGPIRKNKAFFFFAYEHVWNDLGSSTLSNLGLPAWRTGDFSTATRDAGGSAVLVPIYDPASGGKTPFPQNIIPTSRLDPVALKAEAYEPYGNQAPTDPFNNTGNYQSYPVGLYREPSYIGRIDYNLDSNTKLFVRSLYQHVLANFGADPAYGPASSAQVDTQVNQNYALGVTHLFSPTFFGSFTAGFLRGAQVVGNIDNPSINYPQLLGLTNVPGPQFPNFGISGGLVPVTFSGGGPNRFAKIDSTDLTANFTKTLGRHTLKFGGQHNRLSANVKTADGSSGSFSFNGQYTQGVGSNGLPLANTGINLADFLLGDYVSVTVSATPPTGQRVRIYGAYFQDEWRATHKLTLTLGLRYETVSPPFEVHNRMQSFDPSVPNPLAGQNGIPAGAMGITIFENRNGQGKYLWNWDKNGLVPRAGFAYRLANETVIRGGYGIYFESPVLPEEYSGLLGFSQSYTATYSPSNPSPPLKNGIPAGAILFPPESSLTSTFGDLGTSFPQSSISFVYRNKALSYVEQFDFMLQHQWRGMLFEAGYLGTLGRHLTGNLNLNAVPQGLLSQTSVPIQLRRSFTEFSGSNATVSALQDTFGVSDYNAFTFKSERPMNHGVAWAVAYTWSKWLDNQPPGGVSSVSPVLTTANLMKIYNIAGERSLSTNNIPQRLVFSPIVELPVGKGRRFLDRGGLTNGVLGGWEVSLMGTLQSGPTLSPVVLSGGSNILGDPEQTERPNLVGNPASPNQWKPAAGVRGIQFLTASAFTVPSAYTYGDSARTLPDVRGPGMSQYNIMLSKNFRFAERYRMQFRWEVTDVFNTPMFALPDMNVGDGTFGVITATDGITRRVMEFALKLYW
jgi:hypothetical protein